MHKSDLSLRETTNGDNRPLRRAQRLYFLDNLKVVLIVLVVLHHAAQPYGPPDWWYVPGGARSGLLDAFTVVNGSFFMALFFAISAYLVPRSYDRKSGWTFVMGRVKRLAIPFAVGTLTVIPVLMYVYYRLGRDYPPIGFGTYYLQVYLGFGGKPADWSGPTWPDLQFGHLWFIEHLMLYCLLYALWRAASGLLRSGRRSEPAESRGMAGRRGPIATATAMWSVLTVAAGVSVSTAAIRVFSPVNEWEAVLDFIQVEIADLGQYATLFVLGLVAYRRGWLDRFPTEAGYVWLGVGGLLAAIYYAGHDRLDPYFAGGGASLGQLAWSGYESTMGVALCVGLTVLFRQKVNGTDRYARMLATDSFTVYIIHVPIIVALQLALRGSDLAPLPAFAVAGVGGVVVSFALGHYLRKLPGVRAIL